MNDSVLVNFHCHSIFSDGELAPEILAANIAGSGARYAALTDHDSLEGLPRFQEALKRRGVAYLPGVELFTSWNGREIHLLGYGFDPLHSELVATLRSLRQVHDLEVHSIARSLRKMGSNRSNGPDEGPATSAAPDGRLDIGDAIALIHRAGGKAFWAHPLVYEANLERLEACLVELKRQGLDGLEAIYAPFSTVQCESLRRLARKHDLLVCAGTDFHGTDAAGSRDHSIAMPREDWYRFRQAFFSTAGFSDEAEVMSKPAGTVPPQAKTHPFRRRTYVLRIFLPTLIAITLFLAVIWGLILPSFEQTLLERKREMIRELTNSAWSILTAYYRDEQSGALSREQAQELAVTQIEALRYGPESKDYFWIQDLYPRMIMHPYRRDLNGQELLDFTDPRGVPIFVEFAALVKRDGEGYIDYVWQWKDDPERLEPKESYVKGFEPWGWAIGTGIYTDDVHAEINRLEQRLTNTSLAISGAVVLLLVFVLQQSLRIERERQEVLDDLRDSTDRYHSLVEATTEGMLLTVDERCRYANPTFLNMTGYTSRQLEFLELGDLFPPGIHNETVLERIERPAGEAADGEVFEGVLRHADGRMLECVLAMNPIVFAGQRGYILLVRDITHRPETFRDEALSHPATSIPLGIFRARAARRAVLLEMNPAARELVAHLDNPQPALADLFSDPAEYDAFFQALQAGGEVTGYLVHYEPSSAAARFLSLSARLVRDERKSTAYIDGFLQDVTAARRQEAGREALIERLQASLLFLHEPVGRLGREVIVCDLDTSIAEVARQMTGRGLTAALVANQKAVIGIVTDHDLRARALAENVPTDAPVHTIMSAPLTKISEHALIYEALLRMEEKGVRHLAVEARGGQIVSIIDSKSLVQFQRYGPVVLAREISRAANPAEVARAAQRTPPLVKALLDSSARPRHVTNMLASICDSVTERLIELAIQELGPPPAAFAFIAMGSQGRQEQTLLTDQDNGIIYAPPREGGLSDASDYFLRLGERVCTGLDNAGYTLCRGQVMASNPRWCRSLPNWIAEFDAWVGKAEPREIMELSIFFDFRTVYGDAELTRELRRAIQTSLNDPPAYGFFNLFAQNALAFKPPFRLLGSFYLGGGATEHAGEINLKDAMMPMVSFARLYALRHGLPQTHTLERIEALSERGIVQPSSRDEIVASYDFLMQLRLQNQIAAIQAGRSPQNLVHPGRLGYIQQELLKQAFAQIAAVQKKVSYDFLGGV